MFFEFSEKARTLQEQLKAFMDKYIYPNEPEFFRQLNEGGQSNPTFLLDCGDYKYVMRKKPPGKLLPSAHQVDREYRVMKALEHTEVPVPGMYLLCEDEAVIGTTFFVMEYVEGRLFEDATLPGLPPNRPGGHTQLELLYGLCLFSPGQYSAGCL